MTNQNLFTYSAWNKIELDNAKDQGYDLGRKGYPRSFTPYELGTSKDEAWGEGWMKGYTEARMAGFDKGIYRPGKGIVPYGE